MDDQNPVQEGENMEETAGAAPLHSAGHSSSADEAEVAQIDESTEDEEKKADEPGEEMVSEDNAS